MFCTLYFHCFFYLDLSNQFTKDPINYILAASIEAFILCKLNQHKEKLYDFF